MTVIYRDQMLKYLKSISTWVISGIGILIVAMLTALVPSLAIKVGTPNAEIKYLSIVSVVPVVMLSYLTTFVTIYSGLKAATMCKDEIENGSFLTIISKPISRTKIILSKWFALITMIIVHLLIVVGSYVIFIYAFDLGKNFKEQLSIINKKTLTDNVWIDASKLFGILLLLSMLFSSITLLITTKASLSASIASTVFIGIAIPITSVFGSFTQKQEYRKLNSRYLDNIKFIISNANKEIEKSKLGNDKFKIDKNSEVFKSFKNLGNEINNYKTIESKNFKNNLSEVGFFTNETNPFHVTKFLDLNYQNRVLIKSAEDEATFGTSSFIDNLRENFEAKNYYYKPIKEDNLFKANTELTKDIAFKEKLISSLKDLDSLRNAGYNLLYNFLKELFSQIPSVALNLIELNINKENLLYIAATIENYTSALATPDPDLSQSLIAIKKAANKKEENKLTLKSFLPIFKTFFDSYESKTKSLNTYLKNVYENKELNYTAIFSVLFDNLLENNYDENFKIDSKYKLLVKNLLSTYYKLESPISGILFDDYTIESISRIYKVSAKKHHFNSKIDEFIITSKDDKILNKIYSLYQTKNHHLAKLTKEKYMNRTVNLIVYSLITLIFTFTSVYIITKQDFQ
ncbi:ABC transporter permease [Metamycoplasma phocicerebrale]|uniref:ABC transporter permease n=1 Tax=Metamycoplasma phocicerebrale TaxID=142649 RepID=A0A3T0TUP8_9BACT|nr:ABC transporter permease [Metamycoplasma phocicerebrale]AZZ65686.1 ABC transporter permease [Metamycoplasma phocicerebrale]